jgi:Tfp pilus assembly protein PilF
MSNFGVLALKEDDPTEARRYFETVLELEPEDPVAQRYLEYLNEKQ